jgi:CheY-like chemotaxis protein
VEFNSDAPTTKISALVVDDNFFNRDIFRIALEHAGYEVACAENGMQGLELLTARTFNLLVLDLQMPQIDGRAVLKEIHAGNTSASKAMRVVVVTANAHMATEDINDWADYVMYKPINVPEFADFVKRLRDVASKAN